MEPTERHPGTHVHLASGTGDLWQALGHTNEWIRFADTKAAGILVADGVIVSALLSNFQPIDGDNSSLVVVLAVVVWASLLVGAGCCLLCLWPRVNSKDTAQHLYFGSIIAFPDPHRFTESFVDLARQQGVASELCTELWRRSKVAHAKYRAVAIGLSMLGISVSAGVVLALAVLLGN